MVKSVLSLHWLACLNFSWTSKLVSRFNISLFVYVSTCIMMLKELLPCSKSLAWVLVWDWMDCPNRPWVLQVVPEVTWMVQVKRQPPILQWVIIPFHLSWNVVMMFMHFRWELAGVRRLILQQCRTLYIQKYVTKSRHVQNKFIQQTELQFHTMSQDSTLRSIR